MASSPITSWQIDGEKLENLGLWALKLLHMVTFFSWAPKFSVLGLQNHDCSHEIKKRLLLGRKVMINLDCILKSRDITLPTKVHAVKAVVFPVVMYRCESKTIKKAASQRIGSFELWCWRRLLRILWTARKSNQSILKEIKP